MRRRTLVILALAVMGGVLLLATPAEMQTRRYPDTTLTLATLPWEQSPKWLAALDARQTNWQRQQAVGLDCTQSMLEKRDGGGSLTTWRVWICRGYMRLAADNTSEVTLRFRPKLTQAEVRGQGACATLDRELSRMFGAPLRRPGARGPMMTWRLKSQAGLNMKCNPPSKFMPEDEAVLDVLEASEYATLAMMKPDATSGDAIEVRDLPWGANRVTVERLPGMTCMGDQGCDGPLRFGSLRGKGALGLWSGGDGRPGLNTALIRFDPPVPCGDVIKAVPSEFAAGATGLRGLYTWTGQRGAIMMLCEQGSAATLKFVAPR